MDRIIADARRTFLLERGFSYLQWMELAVHVARQRAAKGTIRVQQDRQSPKSRAAIEQELQRRLSRYPPIQHSRGNNIKGNPWGSRRTHS